METEYEAGFCFIVSVLFGMFALLGLIDIGTYGYNKNYLVTTIILGIISVYFGIEFIKHNNELEKEERFK